MKRITLNSELSAVVSIYDCFMSVYLLIKVALNA